MRSSFWISALVLASLILPVGALRAPEESMGIQVLGMT